MNHKDGEIVGQTAMDAISFAQEHFLDTNLLAVVVVLTIEDGDSIKTITHTWPGLGED